MKYRFLLILLVVLATCAPPPSPASSVAIPEVTAAEFLETLKTNDLPIVVNVWASWCLPCRAEAPLLREAALQYAGAVTFLGVDVQDRPEDAAAFIAEFRLDFDHVADPNRSIPATLGGVGVPITYFVARGGEIISTHLGIIDERTLVSGIDDLIRQP
ncbi:MAG: redoxin domain-containing protein [Acidimicrobiia bacterium]|nr:redoxin domain-containing protein [Acidimicrobiia bacterium]